MLKWLRVFLACMAGVLPISAHAEAAGEQRYVWVDKLALRAEPNAKGNELARLPYGTRIVLLADDAAPVAHREVVAKLRMSTEHPAADVTLDGHWRKVQVQGKEGWVFDGYLSRYPAPNAKNRSGVYQDDELAYAAQVFGVAHAWQWNKGDGKKGEPYKVMRRKWNFDGSGASEIYWTHVEFKVGGAGELLSITGDGSSQNLALEGMPLTFNEALLWWRHFYHFDGSGKFEPGRTLDIGPPDDDTSGLGFDRVIECGKETCDVRRDVTD